MPPHPIGPSKPCPICGKPAAAQKDHPFCSPRCRQIDLGRWFLGTYRVETNESPDDEAGQRDD